MGKRKGVGAIKTYGKVPDQRRRRTAHGAYVELASLALHRQRLLEEYKAAARRNLAIEEQIRQMDEHAKVIQKLAEKTDEGLIESIRRKAEPATESERGEHDPGIREWSLDY